MSLSLASSNHVPGQNGTTPIGWNSQWGHFISALAHEIRTPLANIGLSLKLLESMMEGDEQRTYMNIISRNSWKISELVNELLQYHPLEEEHASKYSAQRLLDEVLRVAEDRISLREITVRKKYSEEDCELLIHPRKMKIALNNIIINAIEAMTMERRLLTLAARYVDEGYMIMIEDTGHGISKDDLPRIFTPYFTSKPGGLGLGLATTFGILMSNHAHLSVESEEGVGTRFILLFQHAL
jgi:signal transduction histidine kinase